MTANLRYTRRHRPHTANMSSSSASSVEFVGETVAHGASSSSPSNQQQQQHQKRPANAEAQDDSKAKRQRQEEEEEATVDDARPQQPAPIVLLATATDVQARRGASVDHWSRKQCRTLRELLGSCFLLFRAGVQRRALLICVCMQGVIVFFHRFY